MLVRLVDDRSDGTIHIDKMRNGQIAEVTAWPRAEIIGAIVQQCDKALIFLGRGSEESWQTFFGTDSNSHYRVRILPNGTQLEVTDNE